MFTKIKEDTAMSMARRPLCWQDLEIDERLDLMLSEEIRGRNWAIVMCWLTPGNAASLFAAMAQRGVLWNRNALPKWQQRLYLEEAAVHIRNNRNNRDLKTLLRGVLST
jgi:hypothetical protein